MKPRTRLVLQIAVVVSLCVFLFCYGLGAFGLVGADEPRYSQVAREMFQRNDWVVPTLNNKPWLEKPPLLYWKIMNSYRFLGVQDWAARVPAAFHGMALVLVIFFFMRRFRPGSEMDAAFITAASAAMIAFSRGASTDILLTTYFSLAMLSWWAWHRTQKNLWLSCFYAFLALGALGKGPVAPGLAALVVAGYAVLRRDFKLVLRSLWWPGFLLFIVIALPWYAAVSRQVPQFFHVFFVEHNFERFATNLYQHTQPFWYYLPVFLLSVVPWTIFTIMAIVEACKTGIGQLRPAGAQQDQDSLGIFLMVWILVPVVFFSISRSKLPGYILPVIPAAAILTADYLALKLKALPRWAALVHSLLCGALLGGALLAPSLMLKQHPARNVWIAVSVGAVLTAVLVLLLVLRGGTRIVRFATLIPVIVVLTFLLGPAAPVIDEVSSARTVDARLQELGAPQGHIAVFRVKRDVEYGLNFYRNQPISRYERDGIPDGEHIAIIRAGDDGAFKALLGQRQAALLGGFSPQHLEFFLVSKQ